MKRVLGLFLKTPEDMRVFQRMAAENLPIYRKKYIISVICLLIIAATTAFSAWIMGPVVGDVFYGNDMNRAYVLSATVIAIFLVKGAVSYIQTVLMQRIGNNMVARYQRRLFAHLLDLDVGFFTRRHSVALVAQLNQNTLAVRDLLNTVVLGYVRDLVTLIGLLGVMIYRDPWMTLSVFLFGPPIFYTLARYARRIKTVARQEVGLNSQVAAAMQEGAHGITVVKAFTMEEQLRAKLDALTVLAEERANKIARITARTSPLMETIAGVAIGLVILVGGYRVIYNSSDPSNLTSFMTALLLAYEPAKRLARLRVVLERSLTNARMIYEVLDTQPRRRRTGAQTLQIDGGRVAFDDVVFRYRDEDHEAEEAGEPLIAAPPVIQNLSFVAEAGQTTALVGPSGGGKSTIFSLLQRFYDPEAGTISIDGQDISGVAPQNLREKIAFVSQSPILFQGTVRENLRYARPEASDAELEEAARNAQAHEFIEALPDGYDTPLGENGVSLSGGQRQRISIARAIVRDAPILLLDEATSALDNESEALVQQALDTLMTGRTTLVIAHRLSTISNAHKIIVIDGGQKVDEGTHDELMSRKRGVYARLHEFAGN